MIVPAVAAVGQTPGTTGFDKVGICGLDPTEYVQVRIVVYGGLLFRNV